MAPTPAATSKPAANTGAAHQLAVSEAELVAAAKAGSSSAFEVIMRRHNRLLFRTARAILKDDGDAEDAVQEAYISAFLHLGDFALQSRLATWLVKITVNDALGKRRRRRRSDFQILPESSMDRDSDVTLAGFATAVEDSPEASAAQSEVRRLLESAIDALPQAQRAVFILRAVEDFSTEDTALCLGIPSETVKTRLHRARKQLRRSLEHRVASTLRDTFPFAGARCDRIVATVRRRLSLKPPDS